MKEYQAVMLRLTHHIHDDEDALTDLLNERSRGGWEPALVAQSAPGTGALAGGDRLTVIFQRITAKRGREDEDGGRTAAGTKKSRDE